MTMKPYTEEKKNDYILREFSEDMDSRELVWHRDRKDRVVIPEQCDGWMLQLDNEPPVELEKNRAIFIKAETFHRLHKGNGKLVVKIYE